jgi:hypothetical protein
MIPGLQIRKVVSNPDFEKDAVRLLRLENMSVEEFTSLVGRARQGMEHEVDQVQVLVDRIEFIEHLKTVSRHVAGQGFVINGIELNGFDEDVAALRLYLALTCVDILTPSSKPVGERFKEAFQKSSNGTKAALQMKLFVEINRQHHHDIDNIADCLYAIRNAYTHDGVRFPWEDAVGVGQIQQTRDGKGAVKTLCASEPCDLVAAILDVAVDNAHAVVQSWRRSC